MINIKLNKRYENQPMENSEKKQGFTIIELLIAIVIIGILTSLAVVSIASRADDARLRAAQSDLVSLRKAQEHAAIDTGYYYRLHVLDNVGGGDGDGYQDPLPVGFQDGIQDEPINQQHNNPEQIFIDIGDGSHLTGTQAQAIFDNRLGPNETAFGWQGAYVNWQEEWLFFSNQELSGMPLDPWGNPYLLFTPQGYMDEPDGILRTDTTSQNITSLGSGVSFIPNSFDRMTLISMGPNGIPGDNANPDIGRGDDLKVQW